MAITGTISYINKYGTINENKVYGKTNSTLIYGSVSFPNVVIASGAVDPEYLRILNDGHK